MESMTASSCAAIRLKVTTAACRGLPATAGPRSVSFSAAIGVLLFLFSLFLLLLLIQQIRLFRRGKVVRRVSQNISLIHHLSAVSRFPGVDIHGLFLAQLLGQIVEMATASLGGALLVVCSLWLCDIVCML